MIKKLGKVYKKVQVGVRIAKPLHSAEEPPTHLRTLLEKHALSVKFYDSLLKFTRALGNDYARETSTIFLYQAVSFDANRAIFCHAQVTIESLYKTIVCPVAKKVKKKIKEFLESQVLVIRSLKQKYKQALAEFQVCKERLESYLAEIGDEPIDPTVDPRYQNAYKDLEAAERNHSELADKLSNLISASEEKKEKFLSENMSSLLKAQQDFHSNCLNVLNQVLPSFHKLSQDAPFPLKGRLSSNSSVRPSLPSPSSADTSPAPVSISSSSSATPTTSISSGSAWATLGTSSLSSNSKTRSKTKKGTRKQTSSEKEYVPLDAPDDPTSLDLLKAFLPDARSVTDPETNIRHSLETEGDEEEEDKNGSFTNDALRDSSKRKPPKVPLRIHRGSAVKSPHEQKATPPKTAPERPKIAKSHSHEGLVKFTETGKEEGEKQDGQIGTTLTPPTPSSTLSSSSSSLSSSITGADLRFPSDGSVASPPLTPTSSSARVPSSLSSVLNVSDPLRTEFKHLPISDLIDPPKPLSPYIDLIEQVSTLETPLHRPLSLYIGTWNVGNAPPPEQIHPFLPLGGGHDLYVIGVQECEFKTKPSTSAQEEFMNTIQRTLGVSYHPVVVTTILSLTNKSQKEGPFGEKEKEKDDKQESTLPNVAGMAGVRLIVFAHHQHLTHISHIQTCKEVTGTYGLTYNKGGVAVGVQVYNHWLCFVNCHLPAHQDKANERNSDLRAILAGLSLAHHHIEPAHQYHHFFLFGDLNYRLDQDREKTLQLIREKQFDKLLMFDQLRRFQESGDIFFDFKEGDINFAPTFKLERGQDAYEDVKMRVPSWCDRILWKSLDPKTIKQIEYTSHPSLTTSDHRPVSASYELFTPNVLGTQEVNYSSITSLLFEQILIELPGMKDNSLIKMEFFLPFPPGWTSETIRHRTVDPNWRTAVSLHIPTRFYQFSPALVIAMRRKEKGLNHRVGAASLALSNLDENKQNEVTREIIHKGKCVGMLKASVRVSHFSLNLS